MPNYLHLFYEGKGVDVRPDDTKAGNKKRKEGTEVPARAGEAATAIGWMYQEKCALKSISELEGGVGVKTIQTPA